MNLETLELGYVAPTHPSLQALRRCQSLKSLTLRANVGENQFDELFAPKEDEELSLNDEVNGLSHLHFLSLTITINHGQLSKIFDCCRNLKTLRLHLFDLIPSPQPAPLSASTLTRRQLRQLEASRAAADNPFLLLTSPTIEELQLTTCKDITTIQEKSNGKIPRDFFKAANQLPSLKSLSTNLFPNVNGYKEPETFMSFALDRATCLLPALMATLALRCKKFTQWRDIRNLLGRMLYLGL